MDYKFFADDTQFYFVMENISDANAKFQLIVKCIKRWMSSKRLMLNQNKTKCIPIGTNRNLNNLLERSGFYIDNDFIEFSKSARNLGVLIDNGLTLSEHLDGVVRSATHHLRKIASIKKYLNVSSLKTLVHNLVISRLDYCNSLYYALPNTQLSRIQMILNRAARLISGCSHIDRITPIFDLHWLPV